MIVTLFIFPSKRSPVTIEVSAKRFTDCGSSYKTGLECKIFLYTRLNSMVLAGIRRSLLINDNKENTPPVINKGQKTLSNRIPHVCKARNSKSLANRPKAIKEPSREPKGKAKAII